MHFLILILIPFVSAFVSLVSTISARVSTILGSMLLLFALVVVVSSGYSDTLELAVVPSLSFCIDVDRFGKIFALMVSVLFIPASIYAVVYLCVNAEKNQSQFLFYFCLAISSTLGIAFAGNLFTMFLFYELLTLVTYPLVTHKGDERSKASGRLYLRVLLFSSIIFFLPSLIYIHYTAGNTNFQPFVGDVFVKFILFFCLSYGVAKAALFPLHVWLPAAMVAPVPVSALLHAVAVVKSGAFILIKVYFYMFGLGLGLGGSQLGVTYIAAFSVIFASVTALKQEELKARLAYSTVAQLAYIVMSASLLTYSGFKAAVLHMLAHSFVKIILFFTVGVLYVQAGATKVCEVSGIGHKMPITMSLFSIAALAIMGLPPMPIFWSKMAIFSAVSELDNIPLAIIVLIGVALNVMYLMPIIYSAFFREFTLDRECKDPSFLFLLPIFFTTVITLLMFFVPFSDTIIADVLSVFS